MPDDREPRRSPDQNDPTGRSRAGSPTYRDGQPPSNNLKPRAPRTDPEPSDGEENQEYQG